MVDVPDEFYDWLASGRGDAQPGRPGQDHDIQRYFHGIARARYVLRKVLRMVDEQAKRAGLDPLEHQTLIQVFGADEPLRVNDVAERLDIPSAFASRLVKSLETKGLVTRAASDVDRRTTLVSATAEGRRRLTEVDTQVQVHVNYFQQQLSGLDRAMALGIFAFYVGAAPAREHFSRLEEMISAD